MNLNDLLIADGLDPEKVIVFRHRPREPALFKVLPWLAAERPDLFNAYQQTQSTARVENALRSLVGSGHLASFVGHEAGRALFVGLYSVESSESLTREEFRAIPAYGELDRYGGKRWFTEALAAERPTVEWFDLVPHGFRAAWKGRLVVNWTPPERSWWRRAHRNDLSVHAIHEDSALDAQMPAWQDINVSRDELNILPTRWRQLMSQWRGIYLVHDRSDGKAYVGSAYGSANLLGRWQEYGATGHGGNKLLRGRDPANFRFTILERVSPDAAPDDVIRLEQSWKERLHTRAPAGLNDN